MFKGAYSGPKVNCASLNSASAPNWHSGTRLTVEQRRHTRHCHEASCRRVDLNDIQVRVEQVYLRISHRAGAIDEHPLRIALCGILAETQRNELGEKRLEIVDPQRKMRICVVNARALPK